MSPISGCHINPAVTLGLLLHGKMVRREAVGYVVAQLIGAFLGACLVWAIASGGRTGYDLQAQGLGANGYGAHSPGGYDLGAAFLVEIALTAVLVFTVLRATASEAPV